MKHRDRRLDEDHEADPYDQLLRAGICRKCGCPCEYGCEHIYEYQSPVSPSITDTDECVKCGSPR